MSFDERTCSISGKSLPIKLQGHSWVCLKSILPLPASTPVLIFGELFVLSTAEAVKLKFGASEESVWTPSSDDSLITSLGEFLGDGVFEIEIAFLRR